MKYLVDSSVWLESLMNQGKAPQVVDFLAAVPARDLAMSLFALHSTGVILTRSQQGSAYQKFLQDVIVPGNVAILSLSSSELIEMVTSMTTYRLDFDDAYQYAVAQKHDLTLISFDAHFDRIPMGRKTPEAIVNELTA